MRLVHQSSKQRTTVFTSHLDQLKPEKDKGHGFRDGPSQSGKGEISEVVLGFWEKRERVEAERVEEEMLEFVRQVFEVLIKMARVAMGHLQLKQEGGEEIIQIKSDKQQSEMVLYISHFGTLLTGLLGDVSVCRQFKYIKEVVGSFSGLASQLLKKVPRGLSEGVCSGSSELFEAIKECAGSILRLNGHKQVFYRYELGELFQVLTIQVGRVMWLFDSCHLQQN